MKRDEICPACGFDDHLDCLTSSVGCMNCEVESNAPHVKDVHDVLRSSGIWPRLYVDDYDDYEVCIAARTRPYVLSRPPRTDDGPTPPRLGDWYADVAECRGCAELQAQGWHSACSPGWIKLSELWVRLRDWLSVHGTGTDEIVCTSCGLSTREGVPAAAEAER